MTKKFRNNLIKKIKEEKIRPISKIYFIFKNILINFLFIFSIFVGALSVAIIFGYLYEADWFLTHKIGLIKIIRIFLPFFWLIFLILSSIIAYSNFKNKEKGYKFYCWQIIFGNIITSFIIGLIFYFSGFSQIIENKIQNNLFNYRTYFVCDKILRIKQAWQDEERGLLLGIIISNTKEKNNFKNLKLKDTNNKIWKINISQKTVIKGKIILKYGTRIKLIGNKIERDIFEVEEIRPFRGKGFFGKK